VSCSKDLPINLGFYHQGVKMTKGDNQKTVVKATGAIASVIALITGTFALLKALIPTSLAQPIGALLIGLIFTAILVWMGKWTWAIALSTWLTMSVVVLITYLIIIRPATVIGSIVENDNSPAQGVELSLYDSFGMEHISVTDAEGNFEFGNVPEGRYTIKTKKEGEFLISGSVSSGWERFFGSRERIGQLQVKGSTVLSPTGTAIVTPIPTVIESDGEPEMTVEQLYSEQFMEPGDRGIIDVPYRSKVVIHTKNVRSNNRHIWMFICQPDQDDDKTQCNASELNLSPLGSFNNIVSIGRLGKEGECELLEVGFAIVDTSYNEILKGIPKPILKSSTSGNLLIEDWYQVKRTLTDNGSINVACDSEEAVP